MGRSTLQHDEDTPPVVTRGHGAAALGPGDSSDSGSDVQGATGGAENDLAFRQASDDGDEIGPGAEADIVNVDAESELRADDERATRAGIPDAEHTQDDA